MCILVGANKCKGLEKWKGVQETAKGTLRAVMGKMIVGTKFDSVDGRTER